MSPYGEKQKAFTSHCEYLLSRRSTERALSDEELQVLLFYINQIDGEFLDKQRDASVRDLSQLLV